MPSLDDCPQTALPTPSRAAGLPRNRWLVCVGITGWIQSECPAALSRNAQFCPMGHVRVTITLLEEKTVLVREYEAIHEGKPRLHREHWRRPPTRYGKR